MEEAPNHEREITLEECKSSVLELVKTEMENLEDGIHETKYKERKEELNNKLNILKKAIEVLNLE